MSEAQMRRISFLRHRNELKDAEIAKLRALLKRWMQSGCPDCGGDCASAIPEVSSCIVRDTRAALSEVEKRDG